MRDEAYDCICGMLSQVLCGKDLFPPPLLLAHEGSHVVQPEQPHRHETNITGKTTNHCANTGRDDSVFGVKKFIHTL